jgi:hypothetical protein
MSSGVTTEAGSGVVPAGSKAIIDGLETGGIDVESVGGDEAEELGDVPVDIGAGAGVEFDAVVLPEATDQDVVTLVQPGVPASGDNVHRSEPRSDISDRRTLRAPFRGYDHSIVLLPSSISGCGVRAAWIKSCPTLGIWWAGKMTANAFKI